MKIHFFCGHTRHLYSALATHREIVHRRRISAAHVKVMTFNTTAYDIPAAVPDDEHSPVPKTIVSTTCNMPVTAAAELVGDHACCLSHMRGGGGGGKGHTSKSADAVSIRSG